MVAKSVRFSRFRQFSDLGCNRQEEEDRPMNLNGEVVRPLTLNQPHTHKWGLLHGKLSNRLQLFSNLLSFLLDLEGERIVSLQLR